MPADLLTDARPDEREMTAQCGRDHRHGLPRGDIGRAHRSEWVAFYASPPLFWAALFWLTSWTVIPAQPEQKNAAVQVPLRGITVAHARIGYVVTEPSARGRTLQRSGALSRSRPMCMYNF